MSHDDFFAEIGVPSSSQRRRKRSRARRRNRRRRAFLSTFVIIVVFSVVSFTGYMALNAFHRTSLGDSGVDYTGAGQGEVVVTIPDGASGAQIAQILVDKGVVGSASAFKDAYSANPNASSIQAGTYTLRSHMSAANAVAALLDPSTHSEHKLTISEGSTKAQVREKLVSAGFTEAEVDAAFADPAAIELPDVAGGNVEGWLAPSTYDIPQDATAANVIASMVKLTVQRLDAASVPADQYQTVLIKASIVEREVSSTDYYGKVARVIENRLSQPDAETRGYLQMDSTTLYGLGRSGGSPTQAEINDTSNPWSTHAHPGLPPTPIGSPGDAAIKAVMQPDEGPWLYFVTVNLTTGETLFATTDEEQQANVQKLRDFCTANPTVCNPNDY